MISVATVAVVVWLTGLLFLAAQTLNDIRVVLNHLTPAARYSDFCSGLRIRLVRRINPAVLTDVGRQHQRRAIQHERIMFAWTLGGVILLIGFFSYNQV